MGIFGLTTFINDDFKGWKHEVLHGKLVIDGNNLLHKLYTEDWSNGGQYHQFKEKVVKFFSRLRKSKIDPVVIFDGVDHTQQKTKVSLKRRRDQIAHIQTKIGDHSRDKFCHGYIIPPLCGQVYRRALAELEVELYVADGEGDEVIAKVANHFQCPVLSHDSDFFLFNLKGGYIPYDRFNIDSDPVTAKLYFLEDFAMQYGFQDISLSYVIPAINGNDFLLPCTSQYKTFIFEQVNCHGRPPKYLNTGDVCKFLSRFLSFEDYILSVPERHKEKCLQSRQLYSIPNSLSCESLQESTVLKLHDGTEIPRWFIDIFHQGSIPSIAMEAAVLKEVMFYIVPDDFQQSSSVLLSCPIRCCMYGLLNCESVIEYNRHGMEVIRDRIEIKPVTLPGDEAARLTISSLDIVSPLLRKSIIFKELLCDEVSMERLRGKYQKWQLVVATTIFWVKSGGVHKYVIKALLLCFLTCSGLHNDLTEIRRSRFIRRDFRQSPKWIRVLHAFSQWQFAYLSSISLNAVLMEPLEVISPAHLYDGHIAMSLAANSGDIDRLPFDIDRDLYALLTDIVLSDHLRPVRSTRPNSRAVKKKQENPKKKPSSSAPAFAHTNRFALLQLDSDED